MKCLLFKNRNKAAIVQIKLVYESTNKDVLQRKDDFFKKKNYLSEGKTIYASHTS